MKRSLLIIFSFLLTLNVSAQLNGDGYYRIKNVGSSRYITVNDNHGSVNPNTTSADMGAVDLYKGFDMVESNPASVLYIDNVGNDNYKFKAQGTDTYQIIGYYLKLKKNSDGSYKAYQGNSTLMMYLGDGETSSVVDSKLVTNARGQYRDWNILPISASSNDNYFGVNPEVKATGGHYASFYASFPFSLASSGMEVYYIDKVSDGLAAYKKVTDGVVPAGAPVIVKCSSDNPSNNRLNIGTNSASALADNKLSGVYFCNTSKSHRNVTAYNPETMRVLGTTAKGELAYVKADYDYLPANRSYLTVPAGSPDVIRVVTQEEYYKLVIEPNLTYTVTFKIGDEVIAVQTLKAGDAIKAPSAPTKEGYSFSWGDVPATMPAQNLTIVGTYTINNYTVTFKVGNEVLTTLTLPYGSPIEAPVAPAMEGHTFVAWKDMPATMPAYNLVCQAQYDVNSYAIRYKVDGEDYQTVMVEYGSLISFISYPEKDGRTFSGWSDVPKSMPAYDLEVTGTFMYYVYYYSGNVLVYTEELYFGEAIPSYVYKPSNEDDTFIGWIGESYATMPAHDVIYKANIKGGVEAPATDALIDVYTITGVKVLSRVSLTDARSFLKRGIYIVNGKKMIIE